MEDQQQPTGESVVVAATVLYPVKEITQNLVFVEEICAELETAPDVRDEFFQLLQGLGKQLVGDTRAIEPRATALLSGHPDVLHRFTAFLTDAEAPVAPALGEGLALTRPRRNKRETDTTRTLSLAAAPPTEVPDVAGDGAGGAAASNHGDDHLRFAGAILFLKRVEKAAGAVVLDEFINVLFEAQDSKNDMAAEDIYTRAKKSFGPAHAGLLYEFATTYLPGEDEWKEQEARGLARRQRNRRAPPSSSHVIMADAGDDDTPIKATNSKKKPRADDGNARRHRDLAIAASKSKFRFDDDGNGSGAAAQGRDDDYYAARSRSKKNRQSGNCGECSGSAAAALVLGADAGVHASYSDNKKPSRSTANGGKGSSAAAAAAVAAPNPKPDNNEFQRFRHKWEFQTSYAKLVATSNRVTELRRSLRSDGGGGANLSLEVLFPERECRDFLLKFYGDNWDAMRAALEHGVFNAQALEAMERSLRIKEEEAVIEESRRRMLRDPARAAEWLHGLAMDEERRWQDAADGGA